MSGGWSGSGVNRRWKRDTRGPDDGRFGVTEDVRQILAAWRAQHGWKPGMIWDPHQAAYVWPRP